MAFVKTFDGEQFTNLAEVPFKFDENIHDKLALGDDQILVVENWYSAE